MSRREMKKIATLAFSMATLFNACAMPEDNGTSTAGVLTETESGHTVAFAIEEDLDHVMVPMSAKKSGTVQFALTKIVDGKTELMDSATVEYGDYAVFEDITGA